MDIYFFGTSSGTPTKTRNVSGIAVIENTGRGWYLVDCGEATQHQLLHTKLSLNHLKAIFITHVHGDHCYGLPGLLASAGMSGRTEPLIVVAPKGIEEWFKATQHHTQLYLPYDIQFCTPDNIEQFAFDPYAISSIVLSHRVPSFAYCFVEIKVEPVFNTEKLAKTPIPKGPLWGQLSKGLDIEFEGIQYKSSDFLEIKHQPRKVIVCGDNDNPELLAEASKLSHVLVHEATYTEDMAEKASAAGHSYAKQVAQFAQELTIPNLLLTHFSPRYQDDEKSANNIATLKQEAKAVYSGNLYLAADHERYRLDKNGSLTKVISSNVG